MRLPVLLYYCLTHSVIHLPHFHLLPINFELLDRAEESGGCVQVGLLVTAKRLVDGNNAATMRQAHGKKDASIWRVGWVWVMGVLILPVGWVRDRSTLDEASKVGR